jgi:hypothetical protein
LADIASQGSQPRALFVGLDVRTGSIAVSLAPSDSTEVRRYGLIGGSDDDVLKLAKRLSAAHPQSRFQFCYEAGPHGYPLGRFLRSHGYECIIVCPCRVPRRRHLIALSIGPEEVMKASRCRRGYWWMSGNGIVQRVVAGTAGAGPEGTVDRTALRKPEPTLESGLRQSDQNRLMRTRMSGGVGAEGSIPRLPD